MHGFTAVGCDRHEACHPWLSSLLSEITNYNTNYKTKPQQLPPLKFISDNVTMDRTYQEQERAFAEDRTNAEKLNLELASKELFADDLPQP